MPAKKMSRRAPRGKKMTGDMSPMSLLQTPDEPKPMPMPGPQKMGCSNCGAFPLGAHRLMMVMGALVLVLSSYVVIASVKMNGEDPMLAAVYAFVSPALASK